MPGGLLRGGLQCPESADRWPRRDSYLDGCPAAACDARSLPDQRTRQLGSLAAAAAAPWTCKPSRSAWHSNPAHKEANCYCTARGSGPLQRRGLGHQPVPDGAIGERVMLAGLLQIASRDETSASLTSGHYKTKALAKCTLQMGIVAGAITE